MWAEREEPHWVAHDNSEGKLQPKDSACEEKLGEARAKQCNEGRGLGLLKRLQGKTLVNAGVDP